MRIFLDSKNAGKTPLVRRKVDLSPPATTRIVTTLTLYLFCFKVAKKKKDRVAREKEKKKKKFVRVDPGVLMTTQPLTATAICVIAFHPSRRALQSR